MGCFWNQHVLVFVDVFCFRISEGITDLWEAPPYVLESESQKIKMETATGIGKMCHQTTLANNCCWFWRGISWKVLHIPKYSHLIFVPICHLKEKHIIFHKQTKPPHTISKCPVGDSYLSASGKCRRPLLGLRLQAAWPEAPPKAAAATTAPFSPLPAAWREAPPKATATAATTNSSNNNSSSNNNNNTSSNNNSNNNNNNNNKNKNKNNSNSNSNSNKSSSSSGNSRKPTAHS